MNIRKLFIALLVVAFAVVAPASAMTNFPDGVSSYGIPLPAAPQGITSGDYFFVDSTHSARRDAADHGGTWGKPFATLDFAIGRCTANSGDIIYLAANHAETLDSASGDDIDFDIAGVTVIGIGSGDDRPTFTYGHASAEIVIAAANVTIDNVSFLAGITAVLIGIAVEDGGDYFTLRNCWFPEPADSADDFIDAINFASGANGMRILYNKYYHAVATGPEHFIEAGSGVNTDYIIEGNYLHSQFSVAGIWSDKSDLRILVKDNVIIQLTSTQNAIEYVSGSATGFIVGNRIYVDDQTKAIDPGTCFIADNLVTTAADVSGIDYPVHDTGWTQLNATTLAAIQGEVTTAIAADELDTLIKVASGAGSYPASVVSDSVIAHMISKDDPPAANTGYDNTEDSLEMISDKIGGYAGTGSTGQDESAKAALDLVQIDLDTLTAVQAMGPHYVLTITTGGTATFVDNTFLGYGGDYFETNWMACVIYDQSGASGAPEGECSDITAYNTDTGQFSVSPAFTTTEANDIVMLKRREDLVIDSALLDTTPLAGSLATFIAGGAGGQGTQLATSKSLVDALGTNGTTVVDGATSIAGMLGVDDADNLMATTAVVANDDGSIFERLESLRATGGEVYTVIVTTGEISTEATTCSGLGDLPTAYFVTDWSMLVAFDQGASAVAPEGEIVDITGFTTATGAITHAALTQQTVAGDIVIIFRTADLGAYEMVTDGVVGDDDGSNVERLEHLQTLSDNILAGLRMTGHDVGNVYYVDEAIGSTGYTGVTWITAKAAIVQAYDLAVDNKGDIVFVAPDHEEDLAGATITLDNAGVMIIGLGKNEQMPMITMTAGASKIQVTATDVTIEGIHFYSTTVDNVVTIDADASGLTVRGCQFTGSVAGHILGIDLATSLKDILIEDNFVYDLDADSDAFVNATAGVITNLVIQNNRIWGDYDDAAVHSNQTNLNIIIRDNTINNVNPGQHAVQLTNPATGYIHDNILSATVPGAILDPGSCMAFDNKIVESDMTDAPDHAMMEDGWYYAVKEYDIPGVAATVEIFTVTGLVEVMIYGAITETLTSSSDTIALGGIDGNTDLLIAATAGNAPMSDGDVWTSATMASSAASPSKFVLNGDDISVTENGAGLNDGIIVFHCYWRPLEEGASVVPN